MVFSLQSGRRPSLSSLTSGSEESDCEPSPPSSRLGRRTAIVDTKVGSTDQSLSMDRASHVIQLLREDFVLHNAIVATNKETL